MNVVRGVRVPSDDLTVVVDPEGLRGKAVWNIDRRIRAAREEECVGVEGGIGVCTHDLALVVDSEGFRPDAAREVDRRVDTVG